MHVKQVSLQGFKSYRDQTITDPFSEKINVIVGANGSGKSNFFDAFLFVLDQLTATSHQEERQKLLHEGAGHAVLSAYVELVIDNSDNRLPVDKDEVRLRRTIGLKKDDYYLDKKHITRREVMDLLEAAGFSKANPYYVVKQGKIMSMANMRDGQRLELLKEIGGTKVYEERRKNSMDILKECKDKREQIEGLISQLDERLKELDEERAELAQYQALDKRKRSLQYAILDQELRSIKAELEKVEETLKGALEESGQVQDEMLEAQQQLKATERELRALTQRQAVLQRQQKELREEKKAAIAQKARAELDVKELQERIQAQSRDKEECQADLEAVQREIASKERELAGVRRQLAELEGREAELGREAEAKTRRQQALFSQEGRYSQFATAEERDQWLRSEIKQLEETIAQKQQSLRATQQQAHDAEARLRRLMEDISSKEAEIREREESASRAASDYATQRARRDELLNTQRALFKQDADLESKEKQLRVEEEHARSVAERSMPRDASRGLNSISRFVKERGIQGVHGTLMEVFTCDERLIRAVEKTAGSALYHIVVDDDLVATRLSEMLEKGNCGRATFMPLNRLNPPATRYPEQYGKDVVPLLKKLKYEQRFEPAVRQIFGKTLVCRNLDVARHVALESNLNCITMDGDKVDKKGPMSGGFIDDRRSGIKAFAELRAIQAQHAEARAQRHSVQELLEQVQQEITTVSSKLNKAETQKQHQQEGTAPLRAELRRLQEQQQQLQKDVEAKQKQAADIQSGAESLAANKEELQAQLGTVLRSALSTEERAELHALQPAIAKLQADLASCRERRLEVSASLEGLEQLLSSNLRKQRQDLEDALAGSSLAADTSALQERQDLADAATRELDSVVQRESELEKELEQAQKRIRELSAEREKLGDTTQHDAQKVEDRAKEVDQLRKKKVVLVQNKGDKEAMVRKLGSLPSDAYEKYRRKPLKDLKAKLAEVNEEMQPFKTNINIKALDQYVNFTEQRDDLARRKQENDQAQAKIDDLISVLDHRKDEAVERTFKGVAKNFRDIFAQLVPGGRGELVMQKRLQAAEGEEDEEEDEGLAGPSSRGSDALGKYSGVKVKVSFGGGETMSLKQLSGGQKTLVALALIFAIQRCDPAPFYLLDEVDAALDPQYRTTVASMLRQQANDPRNPAQYIITTFHPQIVMVADRIYGVSHSNKISRIDTVDREDALEFLQAQQQQQQKQQQEGRGGDGEDGVEDMEED